MVTSGASVTFSRAAKGVFCGDRDGCSTLGVDGWPNGCSENSSNRSSPAAPALVPSTTVGQGTSEGPIVCCMAAIGPELMWEGLYRDNKQQQQTVISKSVICDL
jgi:hypothetical protein